MSDAQAPMVTPEQPLSVVLSIQQWRAVLEQLAAPLRPVQAMIADIERQCQTQIARLQQPPLAMNMPPRGNGAEERSDASHS